MSDISVTVILPSLNVCQYIEECLKSVVNQTIKNIEIICIDAGSSDGTVNIINKYAESDSRIKIINSCKRSYGFQVNEGIRNARGKYVGIVETDDFVSSDMYEKLYKCASLNDVDMVKADFDKFAFNEDLNRVYDIFKICSDDNCYNRVISDKSNYLLRTTKNYIWSGIYNKEFLLKNNLFFNETPGASYQDNGFWFLTTVMAKKVYFMPEIFYHLRRDNPNSSFYSKDKVFCVCDEYDYIFDYLVSHSIFEEYASVYWRALFYNYKFTLNRIADEHKWSFLQRFHDDLLSGYNSNQIDFSMFSLREKHDIINIVEYPEKYYIHSVLNKDDSNRNIVKRLYYYAKDYGTSNTVSYIFDYINYLIRKKRNDR